MSLQPAGVQKKIVFSPPLVGLMLTPVMDGAVLSITTALEVSEVPDAVPSVGVAVHAIDCPLLKLDPVMVCVVTDGAPTGGDCWDLGLLGELLEEECRWSSITVDVVLIDGSPGLHSRWREITSRTGGQLTAVRFDEAEEVRSP